MSTAAPPFNTAPESQWQVNPRILPRVKKNVVGSTLLQVDSKLRDRWLAKGLIGHGGYGEIYFAIDQKMNEEVAIKVEPKKKNGHVTQRMVLEQKCLLRMQGRPHVPKMVASGKDQHVNFIVMQLLSINIGDMKKNSPYKRLSQSTTARIIIQAVAALRDVHQIGFLHRDVKSGNMCFGITQNTRHVLMLVDYGLARRYKNPDGALRPFRRRAGFRGTSRYVSVRVHDGMEQSAADDLVALIYTGIELMINELPWKHMSGNRQIRDSKKELHYSDCASIVHIIGDEFQEFARAVDSLNPEDEPNYTAIQSVLLPMMKGKSLSDLYDWEEEYVQVVKEYALPVGRECWAETSEKEQKEKEKEKGKGHVDLAMDVLCGVDPVK